MEIRDRQTREAVIEIGRLLAVAYQRYQRARRIESTAGGAPKPVNGELAKPAPESLHVHEVDE